MKYILPDTIKNVIISPQRAGTTWLQALLGAYLCAAYDLPDQDLMHLAKLTENLETSTAITHDPQRDDPDGLPAALEYRGRRIVLLLRDPRDIIVSLYLRERYRRRLTDLDLPEFVREKMPELLRFYEIWLTCDRAFFSGFATLCYEDLSARTCSELARLVEFLGYKLDYRATQRAADFASFANMKRLELSGQFHEYYKVSDMRPVDDERAMRTRQGKVGSYRDYLTTETLRWINGRLINYPMIRSIYG